MDGLGRANIERRIRSVSEAPTRLGSQFCLRSPSATGFTLRLMTYLGEIPKDYYKVMPAVVFEFKEMRNFVRHWFVINISLI